MSDVPTGGGHAVNWPVLGVVVAILGTGMKMIRDWREAHRKRQERKSEARQAEIAAAVQPIIDKVEIQRKIDHQENSDRLDRFELEQAKMGVKVDDLWERRKEPRP